MSRKRWVSLILIIMLSLSTVSTAFADDLNKKQNQLDNVQDNIKDLQGKIKNIKGEKRTVVSQLNVLDNQISRTRGELNRLTTQVSQTNSTISRTLEELDKAIEEYDDQKGVYSERVKAIYINGPSGYMDILLSAESFSDFISRIDMVKKIMSYDTNLLEEMKDKQEEIKVKKALLDDKKAQLEKLKSGVLAQRSVLDDANKRKKAYYSKLNNDQKELEKALAEEERTSRMLEKQIQQIIASQQGSGGSFSGNVGSILKVSAKITSPYGMRYHPILHKYKMHTGVDYGVKSGTSVYSMADGKVIIAKYLSGYGNTVVVDHGGGITSLYAHNSALVVSVGQKVSKGQQVSKSGSTGYSTGPHLHFEVRKNGTPINPMPYVK